MSDQLRVRVHQWASGLDPAANRARLAEGVTPGADLVVPNLDHVDRAALLEGRLAAASA